MFTVLSATVRVYCVVFSNTRLFFLICQDPIPQYFYFITFPTSFRCSPPTTIAATILGSPRALGPIKIHYVRKQFAFIGFVSLVADCWPLLCFDEIQKIHLVACIHWSKFTSLPSSPLSPGRCAPLESYPTRINNCALQMACENKYNGQCALIDNIEIYMLEIFLQMFLLSKV